MSETTDRPQLGKLFAPRRSNYYFGQLLDELKLFKEQDYFTNMQRLLNRLALGSGVLCGLEITPAADGSHVVLSPGMAVDPFGRLIIVPAETSLDPRQVTDSAGMVISTIPSADSGTVEVRLHYHETQADYALYTAGDCDSSEQSAPDTIVENYCLEVVNTQVFNSPSENEALCSALTGNAADLAERRQNLYAAVPREWPAPPTNDGVALGMVELTGDGQTGMIDTSSDRTILYSNAQLLGAC